MDKFWKYVCPWAWVGGLMLSFDIVLLVLLLMTFPFVEAGTASYYVSLISFGIIGATGIALVVAIRGCRRYQRHKT